MPPPGPGYLLARLRAATGPEHQAVEREIRLLDEALTLAEYLRCLRRFHGIYHPLEQRLEEVDGLAPYLDLAPRLKTLRLRDDLRVLGVPRPETLPRCPDVPEVPSVGAAFGCLYVLEGATLGGQLISRHVQAVLGVDAETGGSFFRAYGPANGAMWREFCRALDAPALLAPGAAEAAERAAVETFRAFRRWIALEP